MKMGMAKVCGFLAMTVLLFILLVDSTLIDLMRETMRFYCHFDFVMTGIYLDAWDEDGVINRDAEHESGRNTIRVTQVFKGPSDMIGVYRIDTSYTEFCRYSPENVNKQFLVLANWMDGEIVCIFNRPWNDLRWEEEDALDRLSKKGCN